MSSEFKVYFTGTKPLLMHNARLSNPLDPITKAIKRISSKRTKSDDDYEELAHLEFLGGLYIDVELGPIVPGQNIERCLVDAAKITRAGKKIERGVFVTSDDNPLLYVGPRSAEELWADLNFRHTASAKVQTNRITRTRPQFRRWEVEATGVLDPTVISLEELGEIAERAGQMIGLGDWRPRFGRFEAVVEKV